MGTKRIYNMKISSILKWMQKAFELSFKTRNVHLIDLLLLLFWQLILQKANLHHHRIDLHTHTTLNTCTAHLHYFFIFCILLLPLYVPRNINQGICICVTMNHQSLSDNCVEPHGSYSSDHPRCHWIIQQSSSITKVQRTANIDMHVNSQNVNPRNPSPDFIMWSLLYCAITYVIVTNSERSWPEMKHTVAQNMAQIFLPHYHITGIKMKHFFIIEYLYRQNGCVNTPGITKWL